MENFFISVTIFAHFIVYYGIAQLIKDYLDRDFPKRVAAIAVLMLVCFLSFSCFTALIEMRLN